MIRVMERRELNGISSSSFYQTAMESCAPLEIKGPRSTLIIYIHQCPRRTQNAPKVSKTLVLLVRDGPPFTSLPSFSPHDKVPSLFRLIRHFRREIGLEIEFRVVGIGYYCRWRADVSFAFAFQIDKSLLGGF